MKFRMVIAIATMAAVWVADARTSSAGCGCDKAPPPAALIRPAFASPGDIVTLFPDGITVGESYEVDFSGEEVEAVGVLKRDLADGELKVLLEVAAPDLPPGPTRVAVEDDDTEILTVDAATFTMLQRALPLGEVTGVTTATCYRAAVGGDGTVYLPFDIGAITDRMIFGGVGANFPLLFNAADIAIYNTQGFLMQLLGPEEAGIFSIVDLGAPHSFALVYDRHEFNTYREDHEHANGYGLDPSDPAWHSDGTRHIDHDHLVLAISGIVEGQGAATPGATPPFDLVVLTSLPTEGGPGSGQQNAVAWGNCN